jgi:hypothetical protein
MSDFVPNIFITNNYMEEPNEDSSLNFLEVDDLQDSLDSIFSSPNLSNELSGILNENATNLFSTPINSASFNSPFNSAPSNSPFNSPPSNNSSKRIRVTVDGNTPSNYGNSQTAAAQNSRIRRSNKLDELKKVTNEN